MWKCSGPFPRMAQNVIESRGMYLCDQGRWPGVQGLGASNSGIAAPVAATGAAGGAPKLGLGTQEHGAVEDGDDAFETYRKRMMLGYKHRPNPLGNPRCLHLPPAQSQLISCSLHACKACAVCLRLYHEWQVH